MITKTKTNSSRKKQNRTLKKLFKKKLTKKQAGGSGNSSAGPTNNFTRPVASTSTPIPKTITITEYFNNIDIEISTILNNITRIDADISTLNKEINNIDKIIGNLSRRVNASRLTEIQLRRFNSIKNNLEKIKIQTLCKIYEADFSSVSYKNIITEIININIQNNNNIQNAIQHFLDMIGINLSIAAAAKNYSIADAINDFMRAITLVNNNFDMISAHDILSSKSFIYFFDTANMANSNERIDSLLFQINNFLDIKSRGVESEKQRYLCILVLHDDNQRRIIRSQEFLNYSNNIILIHSGCPLKVNCESDDYLMQILYEYYLKSKQMPKDNILIISGDNFEWKTNKCKKGVPLVSEVGILTDISPCSDVDINGEPLYTPQESISYQTFRKTFMSRKSGKPHPQVNLRGSLKR